MKPNTSNNEHSEIGGKDSCLCITCEDKLIEQGYTKALKDELDFLIYILGIRRVQTDIDIHITNRIKVLRAKLESK